MTDSGKVLCQITDSKGM